MKTRDALILSLGSVIRGRALLSEAQIKLFPAAC